VPQCTTERLGLGRLILECNEHWIEKTSLSAETQGPLAVGSAVLGHLVAGVAVIACALGFTVVSFFAVFLWAIAVGEPLGGPLALPFMLFLALAGGFAAVAFNFLPATLISTRICRRLQLAWYFEIGVTTLVSALLALAAGVALGLYRDDVMSGVHMAAICELVLLLPLGAYWWSLRSTGWLISLVRHLVGRLFPRSASS
jgi:hypothetical protein